MQATNMPQEWLTAEPDGTALAADAVAATESEDGSSAHTDDVSGW